MDFGVVGLLAITAIVLGAFYVARPRAVASFDELLAALTRIADGELRAITKGVFCAGRWHAVKGTYRVRAGVTAGMTGT
jgi:hypothetical protein